MRNPVHLLSFKKSHQLPVILQSEVAECGLASLAMIACYHGHKIDMTMLRRQYPITLKGATLKDLMDTAVQLKFTCRPLRLELEDLDKLQMPTILHWDLNHFVVLKKVTKSHIEIHDPAKGHRTLPIEEVSKHFTGIALELTPTKAFEPKVEVVTMGLSDLWDKISGLKNSLVQIFILSLLLQTFALVSPFYMQLVIDQVVIGNDRNLLVVLALGFLLLAVIKVATEYLRSFVILYLGNQMNIQMAANLFYHLLRLPLDYFEKRHIGDIVSRFGSLQNVKNLLTTGLIESVVDGIMVIGTLVMMYIYSPLLAFIIIAVVLVYALLRFAMYKPLKQLTEESIVANARQSSNFMETVRAAQSIKIFGRETQRQTVWHNHYAAAMNTDIGVSKLKMRFKAINDLLFGIENVIVIYFGATMIIEGALSVGMLFAFMAYKNQFSTKAAALIEKFIEFRMLSLHLERIADIAMTEQEAIYGDSTTVATELKGQLTLENIGFQYSVSEPLIFKSVSFTFNAGESVALIGPSGCGKTTLAKVMLGLLNPAQGKILADGVDIHKMGLSNYRGQIAAVMQDDQLLSGSMFDNISFFDPSIDEQKVMECAHMAAIHTDIIAMPMAYNTLIGDMGTTLSGGQRQRLLLARALYRQPKILIMDEATSSLDTKLESTVNNAVKQLNMTRIIIAHRPETIKSADRVIELTQEGLVEV